MTNNWLNEPVKIRTVKNLFCFNYWHKIFNQQYNGWQTSCILSKDRWTISKLGKNLFAIITVDKLLISDSNTNYTIWSSFLSSLKTSNIWIKLSFFVSMNMVRLPVRQIPRYLFRTLNRFSEITRAIYVYKQVHANLHLVLSFL